MSETKYAGTCRECKLELGDVAELNCRHPWCPAYAENSTVRVVVDPELERMQPPGWLTHF